MSLFITFEGVEGSGKSVQTRALYRRLFKLAIPVQMTHEPGGTPLGEKISRWLKWSQDTNISPLTELMLFNASRTDLVSEIIQPGLKNGKVIICDRYTDSTIAYQGFGRGIGLETVEAVNSAATQGLKPDLTVLLDISARAGLSRKGEKGQDRFEQENTAFHQRVREGYLNLAANEPQRWLVIDASQSKEKIAQIIWQRVSQMFSIQES